MTTLGSLIVGFFRNYLVKQKGYSPNTLASYSDCVRLLLTFSCERLGLTSDKLSLEMISDQLILDFLDHLEQGRANQATTRNQRLAAIKTFFRFLALQEPTLTAVCERVCAITAKNSVHTLIAPLDHDQIRAILATADSDSLLDARDKAILTLLYNTGARVQELVSSNTSDLRLSAPTQILLTGKGRKQRVVPLFQETVHAIQHYLKLREQADTKNEALFLNSRNQRITRFGMGHIISKRAALAALQHHSLQSRSVTPHTYRHTTALHMIQSGVDITTLKQWLGHADIKTTSLYVDINTEMMRKALEALPPPCLPQTPQPVLPLWHDQPTLDFLHRISRQAALC